MNKKLSGNCLKAHVSYLLSYGFNASQVALMLDVHRVTVERHKGELRKLYHEKRK